MNDPTFDHCFMDLIKKTFSSLGSKMFCQIFPKDLHKIFNNKYFLPIKKNSGFPTIQRKKIKIVLKIFYN